MILPSPTPLTCFSFLGTEQILLEDSNQSVTSAANTNNGNNGEKSDNYTMMELEAPSFMSLSQPQDQSTVTKTGLIDLTGSAEPAMQILDLDANKEIPKPVAAQPKKPVKMFAFGGNSSSNGDSNKAGWNFFVDINAIVQCLEKDKMKQKKEKKEKKAKKKRTKKTKLEKQMPRRFFNQDLPTNNLLIYSSYLIVALTNYKCLNK